MLWPALGSDSFDDALAAHEALIATDLWSCDFSVVDIETTGSVAGRDGMTEIAIVRVREGRIEHAWRSFVNPSLPIPPFITRLTGISDDMVACAPPIGALLPGIVERVGRSIVVGHNVRFDAGFINYELRRHDLAALMNPTLDTLTLARRTIAEVANYKLGTLTQELGFDVERHHRALADARATAELLVHCIKRLEDAGVFTYGALLDFLRARPARKRRAPVRFFGPSQLPVWTTALRDELSDTPTRPGVYLLKDAGDAVVYVGKSKNLRQRLRTYVGGNRRPGPKAGALRSVLASFDYLVTGSEFEALLLEAELVRKHDPPFNDRLRNFREFTFVKVEPAAFGRIMTTTRLAADGARYYGPFRHGPAVRAAVAALQDALGIGSFEDDICGARDRMPAAQHAALVDDAIAFIEGAADHVMLAVARRRDEAAARQRKDVAEREERRLERLRRLRGRHAALEAATGINAIVMAPSALAGEEACFLFCGGRLAGQCRLPRRLPDRERALERLAGLIGDSYRPSETPRCFTRQEEIDQLFILEAWHRDRREALSYVDLPPDTPSQQEARTWAELILSGEPLDTGEACGRSPTGGACLEMAGAVPKHEGEQREEQTAHRIEERGASAADAAFDRRTA